ncbi:hypothetical protein CC80DRAFT_424775, partial [Byssothecium circinans]
TPWLRNISSFTNLTKYRKYIDDVLKEELGPMYIRVPSLFKAFFSKITGLELAT